MRIIAGIYKNRPLTAPKGRDTRPTAEVVREALFSILGRRLVGARIWDVFAGSGALGLEALSRGASEALFTDSSVKALQAINHNLAQLGEARAETRFWRAPHGLGRLGLSAPFALIFLDPPYESSLALSALTAITQARLAAPDTLALWEHDRRMKPDDQLPEGWQLLETRHWGRRAVSFLELKPQK